MSAEPLRDLYPEVLLAHANSPRNTGELADATGMAAGHNPTCGDKVRVWVRVGADGTVEALRFEASGCALSKASASIMTSALRGKPVDAVRASITQAIEAIMRGDGQALAAFGEAPCLAGVAKFPGRVKCVTMAWHAAAQALKPT